MRCRHFQYYCLLLAVFLICSCDRYGFSVFQRVNYVRAIHYLESTNVGAYSMEGESLEIYYSQLDSFYRRNDADMWSLYAFQDSLFENGNYFKDLHRKEDRRFLDRQYLQSRVENALELKNYPFAKSLRFNDFCEYLLPYRIGNEELEEWWIDYRSTFGYKLDPVISSPNVTLDSFCAAVNGLVPEPHRSYTGYPEGKPSMRPSALKKIYGGTCNDYVALTTFLCRSYGIPTAVDFTPQWSNHSQGHNWCAVIQGDSTYHYMVGEPIFLAREKPFTFKATKIYRRMNSVQKKSFVGRFSVENVPVNLRDPRMIDVTRSYMDVVPVCIDGLGEKKRSRYVYLCCFNDREWIPVDGARRRGVRVEFDDVGYPAVMLPQYYEDGALYPAQYPIKIDSSGILTFLKPDRERLRTVRLTRKFMDLKAWQFVDSLRGGHFELSQHADFREAYKIAIPESVGFNYQAVDVDGRFRYVRYVPTPGGTGNISEIEIYDDKGSRLDGRVIGNYHYSDAFHPMENAFDGNVLSYASCSKSQSDAWLGLDMGADISISKLCYLPRSDDNFIRDGEEYELCYWDGYWVSLGSRFGSRDTQELVYDNVPDNALLLLHNHTRGKEERIFTYENGRQVWW